MVQNFQFHFHYQLVYTTCRSFFDYLFAQLTLELSYATYLSFCDCVFVQLTLELQRIS